MVTFVKIKNNERLEKSAAESAERLFVSVPGTFVNSGYRSDAEQEKIFLQRFTTTYTQYVPGKVDARRYNGRTYYRKPGYASAAAPGTSNHRLGDTADFGPNLTSFSSTRYKALEKAGPYHGWNNTEGRRISEPWHWTYRKADDRSLARRGWYHVARSGTNVYSVKTGKKTYSRKAGFNVYISHGILVNGAEWVVTNHGNRYRLSHLDKGKAPAKPKYRTVHTTPTALNGRAAPSTSSKIKFVRPKGFKLVVRDVPGHPNWVVTKYNTYYWKAYTK